MDFIQDYHRGNNIRYISDTIFNLLHASSRHVNREKKSENCGSPTKASYPDILILN